jgi:hypothetical protein
MRMDKLLFAQVLEKTVVHPHVSQIDKYRIPKESTTRQNVKSRVKIMSSPRAVYE